MDLSTVSSTRLSDVVDLTELANEIAAGNVRTRPHPEQDRLVVLNYTEAPMRDRRWPSAVRVCRGLVVRLDRQVGGSGADGDVVARPWAKFFNHAEVEADPIGLDEPAEVTEKQDGSLGIVFTGPDGAPAVATRGSFASDQAVHATKVLRARYDTARLRDHLVGHTVLVEIEFPANRVVLDYGDRDDLVLLGSRVIASGALHGPERTAAALEWTGPVTEVLGPTTLREVLAAPPRPGVEGVVVRVGDQQVKAKEPAYVALHRLLFGLNDRVLWVRLAVNAVLASGSAPDGQAGAWQVAGAGEVVSAGEVVGTGRAAPAAALVDPKQLEKDLGYDWRLIEQVVTAGPDWQRELEGAVPEEFRPWISDRVAVLRAREREVEAAARALADGALRSAVPGDRAGLAAFVLTHAAEGDTRAAFHLLDGKDVTARCWRLARPRADQPMLRHSEDTA